MKMLAGKNPCDLVRGRQPAALAIAAPIAALVLTYCVGAAEAQTGKLGTYKGTINVSGTEVDPKVTYRASVKVNLPVSQRKDTSVTAEFLAGEAPDATVQISQWDIAYTQKSAGSDGKFSSWNCALAAPVEIPMSAMGVLDANLKTKKHAFSLTLISTRDVAFNCMHSRSGPYKKKQGVSLYIGTGAPGEQHATQLPFTDPARLTATYTLMPTATMRERGPVKQEWDLQLVR